MNDDSEVRQTVSEELYLDEKLLWVGKPTPLRVVRHQLAGEMTATDRNIVYATVGLILVIILITVDPIDGLNDLAIGTFHVAPAGGILAALILGDLAYLSFKTWRASQIVYGITSRRLLIIEQTIDGKRVFAYNQITDLKRRFSANDSGDLIFATEPYTVKNRRGRPIVYRRDMGFFGIDNVREVEGLILKTFGKESMTHHDS